MAALSDLVSKASRAACGTLTRLFGARPAPKLAEWLSRREHKLYGLEIFPGVGTPLSYTTRYGATFAAIERGRRPLVMAGWVNYTPIFFKPKTVCTVVGGRWFLLEMKGAWPGGLAYGTFRGGEVRWNEDAKLATASMEMDLSRYGDVHEDSHVAGKLVAALNHHPFPPSPPRIGATLRFRASEGK